MGWTRAPPLHLEVPATSSRLEEGSGNVAARLPIPTCFPSHKAISESGSRVALEGRTILQNFCKESPKRHMQMKLNLHLPTHAGWAVSEVIFRGLYCHDRSTLLEESREWTHSSP